MGRGRPPHARSCPPSARRRSPVHEMRAIEVRTIRACRNCEPGREGRSGRRSASEVIVDGACRASTDPVDSLVVTGAYQFLPELPFTPGKGPAGVVCATGPGSRTPACRRPRAGNGGAGRLCRKSRGRRGPMLSTKAQDCRAFVQAAAMGVAFDTAWCALRDRGAPATWRNRARARSFRALSASPRCNSRRRWDPG